MIRHHLRHSVLGIAIILAALSVADTARPAVPRDQVAGTEQGQATDPADSVGTSTLDVYPYIFFTPETKIAIGGGRSYTWRYAGEDPDLAPNSVMAAFPRRGFRRDRSRGPLPGSIRLGKSETERRSGPALCVRYPGKHCPADGFRFRGKWEPRPLHHDQRGILIVRPPAGIRTG